MHEVFISYERKDRKAARAIAEMFARHGFDVWWDVELLPGQKFAKEINSVIRKSKAVVVLWTPESVRSHWVRSEAALAMDREILVPAWLRKTDIPVPFNILHTHDLTDCNGDSKDTTLTPLLDGVRHLAGRPRESRLSRTRDEISHVLDEPAHEAEYWASVANKDPQSAREYEAYLERYGDAGTFAELARLRVDEIRERSHSDNEKRAPPRSRNFVFLFVALILVIAAGALTIRWDGFAPDQTRLLPSVEIRGPATAPLGSTTYFTVISENAIRGAWSIGGFTKEPVSVDPLGPSHQIFVEPTDTGRVGHSFTIVFTVYSPSGDTVSTEKSFIVGSMSGSRR